ncbi:hypothetical protein [Kitasatospora sp. NPDC002965]|uniref:hypothetical protein n=1 Tax=Kitasatospora sp. NPDC002965 TaxID=3154775 RepID=UPI0033AE9B33
MDFQQLKSAGLYPIAHISGRPSTPMPEHVAACPKHRVLWTAWHDNTYDWRKPREWGGGHIMDCRTDHQERAYDWAEKNLAQMNAAALSCKQRRGCTSVKEDA